MIWDNREIIKRSDFPATVYKLLKYLVEEESFEDKVVFERPRTIHNKDVESSLEGLKWAAENGEFWFMGPFDWIRFQCKSSTLEGTLFVGNEVMVFKTLVKVGEVEKLLSMFEQQGLEVDIQEVGHFAAELSIWDKKSFSLQHTIKFMTKLKNTLEKRKPKSPR